MFVLADTYRFLWPATAMVPDPAQPGKVVPQKFKLLFEAMGRDKVIAMQEASTEAGEDPNYKLLLQVIKGWEEITGSDQETPIPFTEATLSQAMQISWFRVAAWNAYAEALSGEAARLGN